MPALMQLTVCCDHSDGDAQCEATATMTALVRSKGDMRAATLAVDNPPEGWTMTMRMFSHDVVCFCPKHNLAETGP